MSRSNPKRRPIPPSQRAERAVGPTQNDKIRAATSMMVVIGKRFGHDDEKIRADVRDAIREALEGKSEQEVEVSVQDTDQGPTEMISYVGIFRLVLGHFNIDRTDQWEQERLFSLVQKSLDEALARTDGDYRRKTPV